jgi:hypothetical protein
MFWPIRSEIKLNTVFFDEANPNTQFRNFEKVFKKYRGAYLCSDDFMALCCEDLGPFVVHKKNFFL